MKGYHIMGLVAGVVLGFGAQAQLLNTFYSFNGVNQNLMVNPSAPHSFKMVIGIPGLSGVGFHYNNTAFELGDLANDQSANENVEAILAGLDGKERFNFYENLDVLYAGFGTKRGFVSFGIQQEANFLMNVPGDLLRFAYYGNVGGTNQITFEDNSFNAEALIQVNYHVGYQHYLADSSWIVGGRFKYVSGTAHGHFRRFDATLQSDIFEWKIQTDILAETSGFQTIQNFDSLSPAQFFNSGNPGFAFDLGATYLWKKWTFSASALNLGSVKWTQDLKMYQSQGDFTWKGADIDENNQDVDFGQILDSLQQALEFKEIPPYSYRNALPMQFMAAVQYNLTPKHGFSVTYQGTQWKGNHYPSFGVNYLGNFARRFNMVLGYSRLSGGANNVGIGLTAALGPIQLFLMTDNVFGALQPVNLSATSLRVGLNVVFFDPKPTSNAVEPL
jgi:hypothetical protein